MSARPFLDDAFAALDPSVDPRVSQLPFEVHLNACMTLAYWPKCMGAPLVQLFDQNGHPPFVMMSTHESMRKGPRVAMVAQFGLAGQDINSVCTKEYSTCKDRGYHILSHELTFKTASEFIDHLHTVWTHTDLPYDQNP